MNNWKENGSLFCDFNREITQRWIKEGFTKGKTEEWLRAYNFDIFWKSVEFRSAAAYWLQNIKNIQVNDLKTYSVDQMTNLVKQYGIWIKDFLWCDGCQKRIKRDDFFFSDQKNNLDFCSENCQIKLKEDKEKVLLWKKISDNFSLDEIEEWEYFNLTIKDAKLWVGLDCSIYHPKKIYYWKHTGQIPTTKEELESLKKAAVPAQRWFDLLYPQNDLCLINDGRERVDAPNNQGKTLASSRVQVTSLSLGELNSTGPLVLTDFINLWYLGCERSELTSLEFNNCPNLRKIFVQHNSKLTTLILPIPNQLEEIIAQGNRLTTINLEVCNPATLTKLWLTNNSLTITDLVVFRNLTNLKELYIRGAAYFKSGLEYLPSSLESLDFSGSSLIEELKLYNDNLATWQSSHPHLMQAAGQEVREIVYEKTKIKITIPELLEEKKFSRREIQRRRFVEREEENDNVSKNIDDQLTNLNYRNFFLRDHRPFSWEVKKPLEINISGERSAPESKLSRETKKSLETDVSVEQNAPEIKISGEQNVPENKFSEEINKSFENKSPEISSGENKLGDTDNQSLPLRLYNLKTDLVETTSDNQNINSYLILSYCWGAVWEDKKKPYGQNYETDLTELGRKALNKVKVFYQSFNYINHIWIDNFCINQSDPIEKGQEVNNQKNYYSNATATLINIDAKVLDTFPLDNAEIGKQVDKDDKLALAKHLLKLITESTWFTRSWTFQEGLLSKQTIFMFDDYLVDGRILAQYWGGLQFKGGIRTKIDPIIHITPLGWSFCNNSNQTANLTLGEALHAVSKRSQTVLVDGVYAFLGLLPYGHLVETNYKDKLCQRCKDIEQQLKKTIICSHEDALKTESPTYFQVDLENVFQALIKAVVQNGYGSDLLSWWGPRNSQLVPEINQNGNINVRKLVDPEKIEKIREKFITITENTIHLKDVIASFVKGVKEEEGWVFDKRVWQHIVEIEKGAVVSENIPCSIREGDILIVFDLRIENSASPWPIIILLIPKNHQRSLYVFDVDQMEIGSNFSPEVLVNLKDRIMIKGEEKIALYKANPQVINQIFNCASCSKETDFEKTYFNEQGLNFCSENCKYSEFRFFCQKCSKETDFEKTYFNEQGLNFCSQYCEYYGPFVCDQCRRKVYIEDFYFSDREQNLDFCSAECQTQWETVKKVENETANKELTEEEYTTTIEQLDISQN